MAPRGTPKSTTQVHRVFSKCNTTLKTKSTSNTFQRTMMTRRSLNVKDSIAPTQKTIVKQTNPVKVNLNDKVADSAQPKDNSNPRQPLSPLKQNKPPAQPGSVTKSGKKPTWSRRPKPAHSGVPVPEKMKKLFEKLAKEALIGEARVSEQLLQKSSIPVQRCRAYMPKRNPLIKT